MGVAYSADATMTGLEPSVGRWVDGVGDEVVVVGGGLVAISMTLLAVWLLSGGSRYKNVRRREVHPEQTRTVQTTRREMGVVEGVRASTDTESCAICLSPFTHPVDTNCGHTFCAQCLLSYWQHDQWPRPARCAVCRTPVTLMLPSPSLTASSDPDLWRRVVDYNQRMSGQPRPLLNYLYDVPVILSHMWRHLFTVQGLVVLHKLHVLLIVVFLCLYLISPLDIIPEAVFGVLGLVDDLVILLGVVAYVSVIYRLHVTRGDV